MSALNREYDDRSYCFGRLAAVYDIAERNTFPPNHFPEPLVCRLPEGFFINHPGEAMTKLEAHMNAGVWGKLKPASREFFRQEIAEILDKIDVTEEALTKPLNYHFTEGYYHERSWLRNRNKNKDGTENAE